MAKTFPRLFSFAKDKQSSVKEVLSLANLHDGFHLPLSVEAFQEYNGLKQLLHGHALTDQDDAWVFNSNKGAYTPKAFYNLFFAQIPIHTPSKWIWPSKCISKHKFFAWLILHDRINTKDMMLRRHWKVTDNNDCVLCCAHTREDRDHLFFGCQFSARIWCYLQVGWCNGTMDASIIQAKRNFKGPCFSEIVILACWNIWKQRNDWIFEGIRPTFRG